MKNSDRNSKKVKAFDSAALNFYYDMTIHSNISNALLSGPATVKARPTLQNQSLAVSPPMQAGLVHS